jgi:hypothetical protein
MDQETSVAGWLARVTTPGLGPHWFVAAIVNRQEAAAEIRDHPDVGRDHVEIVEKLTAPNMMGFDLRPGEVKQIDAPLTP